MSDFTFKTHPNGVQYAYAPALGGRHGFLTRCGGVSTGIFASLNLREASEDDPERVRENYRRVKDCFAVEKLVFSRQIHGNTVRPVTAADAREPYAPSLFEADGLITAQRGLGLIIFTADCIPLLLRDPVRHIAAAVHAGWRGTVTDIAGKAVEAFVALGSDPADIVAAIGPGICAAHYETGEEVSQAALALLPEAETCISPSAREGHWLVDLKGLNRLLLLRRGVGEVAVSPSCTYASPDLFWSHRYTAGRRGVQGSVIVNE